jgi:hypothetical protein
LEKVRGGEAQFNRQAGDRVLGLSPVRTADAEPNTAVIQGDGRLNDDQMLAVRRSLGSDTTYVWGPPGTGKTMTLARIVEAHYRTGRSVLLVSNTNIAVDTALERVAERLKSEPEFHQGLVIRQGPVVKAELRQRFGPQVILEEIVARLGEALRYGRIISREAAPRDRRARAPRRIEGLDQQACSPRSHRGEKDLRPPLNIALKTREAQQHAPAPRSFATIWSARSWALCAFPVSIRSASDARSRLPTAGPWLTRTQPGPSLATFPRTRPGLERSATRSTASPTRPGPILQGRRSRRVLHPFAPVSDRSASALSPSTASSLRSTGMLTDCRILATTVYRTYLGKSTSRQFDVVVIDEASMLMAPLVYYAAGLATQSVTVAGDFRQLPPIVMSDEPLAREWLKRDVFEKAGIPERLQRGEPTPHLVPLGTQYRMREPICEIINILFYADRPLRSDPCVSRGGGTFPFGTSPLLYVDTSLFHPWTALRVGSYSRYNLFHALLVRNIILHLAETGFLPPAGEANDAVGAIALTLAGAPDPGARRTGSRPPQASPLPSMVPGQRRRRWCSTPIRSSTARALLRASRIGRTALLNVAASRARYRRAGRQLQYLRAKAPGDAIVRRLIGNFEAHGGRDIPPRSRRATGWTVFTVMPASFDSRKARPARLPRVPSTSVPADLARAHEST